jgi:hypothetical protein
VLVTLSLATIAPAHAVLVTWELNNVILDDGGEVHGMFQWDAGLPSPHQLADWDLITTFGTTLSAFEYSRGTAPNSKAFEVSARAAGLAWSAAPTDDGQIRSLVLVFDSLPPNGGLAVIRVNDRISRDQFAVSSDTVIARQVVQGHAIGVPAIPEIPIVAISGAGIILLILRFTARSPFAGAR